MVKSSGIFDLFDGEGLAHWHGHGRFDGEAAVGIVQGDDLDAPGPSVEEEGRGKVLVRVGGDEREAGVKGGACEGHDQKDGKDPRERFHVILVWRRDSDGPPK